MSTQKQMSVTVLINKGPSWKLSTLLVSSRHHTVESLSSLETHRNTSSAEEVQSDEGEMLMQLVK